MKKLLSAIALAGLVLLATGTASAVLVHFDDITTVVGSAVIPDGYEGLSWGEFWVIHEDVNPGSGYDNGVVSGEYAAYRHGPTYATTLSSGVAVYDPALPAFDFEGAYLTAAWNNGLSITIAGYYDGGLVHTDTVVVNTTGPTWFDGSGDYSNIDLLYFSSSGGTNAGLGGEGVHFVMDNFTYTPIPEPTTMLMLGCLGAGLAGARKLGRKK